MKDAEIIRRDIRPSLVFLSGELIAVPIPLEREEVILGRAIEADVRVNDFLVSRKHASITAVPTSSRVAMEYILQDLDSRNGTFLNGRRIRKEKLEKDKDNLDSAINGANWVLEQRVKELEKAKLQASISGVPRHLV